MLLERERPSSLKLVLKWQVSARSRMLDYGEHGTRLLWRYFILQWSRSFLGGPFSYAVPQNPCLWPRCLQSQVTHEVFQPASHVGGLGLQQRQAWQQRLNLRRWRRLPGGTFSQSHSVGPETPSLWFGSQVLVSRRSFSLALKETSSRKVAVLCFLQTGSARLKRRSIAAGLSPFPALEEGGRAWFGESFKSFPLRERTGFSARFPRSLRGFFWVI